MDANKLENTSKQDAKNTATDNLGDKLIHLRDREAPEKVARDINTKLNDIENQILRVCLEFGQSQKSLKQLVAEVEVDQQGLEQQIEELTGQFKISSRNQSKLNDALKEHFSDLFSSLKTRLDSTFFELERHEDRLQSLDVDQQSLAQKHVDLAEMVAEQKTALELIESALTANISRNSENINALQTQQNSDKESLRLLAVDQEQLREFTIDVDGKLTELRLDTAEDQRRTGKRFTLLASIVACVTIALSGALAYFEFNPLRAPDALVTQVEAIQRSVVDVNDGVTQLTWDMQQQSGQLQITDQKSLQNFTDIQLLQSNFEINSTELEARIGDLEYRIVGPGTVQGELSEPRLPLQDQSWLVELPGDVYSIQLAGFYRHRQLVNFINLHSASLLDQPLAYSKTKLGLRDWYNLYYGEFPTMDAAEAVLDGLPARLLRSSPYVRSMASVQKGLQ